MYIFDNVSECVERAVQGLKRNASPGTNLDEKTVLDAPVERPPNTTRTELSVYSRNH